MTYSEDDLIPISALQHMVFCERQAALIHVERLWDENVLTIEGDSLHERVHSEGAETNRDVYTVRGLRVRSLRLGLVGMTDVVEFRKVSPGTKGGVTLNRMAGCWQPSVVEYKRGRPKADRSDEVQLCAQAMCLEEMLAIFIENSAFFYGRPRRRHTIALSDELRRETEEVATKMHQLFVSGKTPAPIYGRKCRRCSLIDLCLPRAASRTRVRRYLEKMLLPGGEE